MSVFGFVDAFHIVEPMLSGTILTAWVVAPIYCWIQLSNIDNSTNSQT